MKKIHRKKEGFALLYIMLILAGVVTAVSFGVSQSALSSAERSKLYGKAANVRMTAMSCGEELLMRINDNTSLTESGVINYGDGSCEYDITGSIPNKSIQIVANKGGVYEKVTIDVLVKNR